VLASTFVVACTEADPARPEGEALRLGRVHVVLEPADDAIAPEGRDGVDPEVDTQLEVTARFAFVRGLDEELARARIDVPVLPHDALQAGACVPSSSLVLEAIEPDDNGARELVLVDAGDLSIDIGDSRFDVPLVLVPDLLPYMSGVEYLHEADARPMRADATPVVVVVAQGSLTDDVPPFTERGRVPRALELGATEADLAELQRGALVVRWAGAGEDDVITLRLLPLANGEAAGDEITCVVADRGTARLDLAQLAVLGLPRLVAGGRADAIRVTASRTAVSTFDAGDFSGTELVVERRERLTIAAR
jgi:hypothetical protein